jgi:hypothetical protein
MMSDLHDALAGLCGRSLIAVGALEHVHDDMRSLIAVWLEFSDGGLQLRTAPDGWGLTVDSSAPQPADLGESGRLEVTGGGIAELGPGQVTAVSTVLCSESRRPVGVRLQVDTAAPTIIYSYDDDLLVGREVSDDLSDVHYELVCAQP